MKFSAFILVVILVCYDVAQGHGSRRKGSSGGRGTFRSWRRFGTRSRSNSPETCEAADCPPDMECQMSESRFCRRGQCLIPFCVRVGPILTSAVDNPGACPVSTLDTSGGCPGNEVLSCANDTVCQINQKCCVVGCGLQCMNVTSLALAESRATSRSRFPARGMAFMKLKDKMRKMKPKSNAYFCPNIPGDAFSSTCATMTCESDAECEGNKRCCLAGCGKRCINPVSIVSVGEERGMKTGKSFRHRAAATANVTSSTEEPAASAQMTSKAGVCPTVAIDAQIDAQSCREDTDCNGTMKCCAQGQGLACFEPFRMRLPSPLMSSRLSLRLNDGNEQSLLRIRGMCPSSVPGFTCGSTCTGDNNCTSGQLCCSLGACDECISPVISSSFMNSRPGLCPAFAPNLSTLCQVSCSMDSDCNIGTKCCSVGCSRQCINPIGRTDAMIKAGTCPIVTPTALSAADTETTTPAKPERRGNFRFGHRARGFRRPGASGDSCQFRHINSCRSDADCPKTRKCCKDGCDRMTCVDAV